MAVKEQTTLGQYVHHSQVLDNEGLREFWRDMDFTLLCSNRAALEDASLDPGESQKLKEADERLSAAFDPETLANYAGYYPQMPIRSWWS